MSDYAVQLINVCKTFVGATRDEVHAVDHVQMDIRHGEFFSFLGPSGCGKTTTLRMIAGFEMPSNGEILIQGKSMGHMPAFKRPVNTVFQNYALWPHMTVQQNVAFGLEMKKVPKDEIKQRVGEALEMVHLQGMEHRKPRQLSGGQQQRVALARALVQRPAVLLLDEPLGALDLKLRKAMQLELKHMQEQVGITFIYVTHDQEEALTMSDRIAIMHQGRLEQLGDPKEIYEQPTTRYVADFIGETNFLEGKISHLDPAWATVVIDETFTMRAPSIDGLTAGQSVTVALRPEKIGVQGMPAPMPECVPGRVVEVIYIGTDTRYIVQLTDNTRVVARVQNLAMGAVVNYSPGSEVVLNWEPATARILTH
jgi:spermidine/putrescine transport system ATP-binding protein